MQLADDVWMQLQILSEPRQAIFETSVERTIMTCVPEACVLSIARRCKAGNLSILAYALESSCMNFKA